jgi:hypothetical protein
MQEMLNAAQEPDAQELLEIERAKRLDEAVRLWLIYNALEYGNAALVDVAHVNYLKAWQTYLHLFTNTPEESLRANFRNACVNAFYGQFGKDVLGVTNVKG